MAPSARFQSAKGARVPYQRTVIRTVRFLEKKGEYTNKSVIGRHSGGAFVVSSNTKNRKVSGFRRFQVVPRALRAFQGVSAIAMAE